VMRGNYESLVSMGKDKGLPWHWCKILSET
jgi:hypothetical protein